MELLTSWKFPVALQQAFYKHFKFRHDLSLHNVTDISSVTEEALDLAEIYWNLLSILLVFSEVQI